MAGNRPVNRPSESEDIDLEDSAEYQQQLQYLATLPRVRRSRRLQLKICLNNINISRAANKLPLAGYKPPIHLTPKQTRARRRLQERTFTHTHQTVDRIVRKYREDPTYRGYTRPENNPEDLLPEDDPSKDYRYRSPSLSPSPAASELLQASPVPSTPSTTKIYGLQVRSVSATPSPRSSSRSEYHPSNSSTASPCPTSSHRHSKTLRSSTTIAGTSSGPEA